MSRDFRGQVLLVTGASSGIGHGLALRFGREGARVVLVARRKEALEEVASRIRAEGGTALVAAGDVTVHGDVARIVGEALDAYGRIDILINCAGLSLPRRFEDTSRDQARQLMETNFFAPAEIIRQTLPVMRRQKSGHVVNVASMLGLKGLPDYTGYTASKFALVGFSDALRYEVKRDGIAVSVICPPGVHTPMVDDIWDEHPDWFKKFRILTVEQVVDAVVRGMRRRRFLIFVSADTKLMYALLRFFPRAFPWMMARLLGLEK